jgi:hypothetical protein
VLVSECAIYRVALGTRHACIRAFLPLIVESYFLILL